MNKKTVMIAVLAVAVIAIAATFAAIGNGDGGKDDYVAPKDTRLWIFGNANMDDRLDENDMKYLDRILSGEREPTQFADANNDGDVNEKDREYLRKLLDRDPTVRKHYLQDDGKSTSYVIGTTKTLGLKYNTNIYAASALGCLDILKMVDDSTLKGIKGGSYGKFLQNQNITTFGSGTNDEYNFEEMHKSGVDSFLASSATYYFEGIEDKMTDDIRFNVIRIGIWKMDDVATGLLTIANLLNNDTYIANAEKYVEFYDKTEKMVSEATSKTSDKKTLLILAAYKSGTMEVQGPKTGCYETSLKAGLKNLAYDMPGYFETDVDNVLKKNPDYVFVISNNAWWDCEQSAIDEEYKGLSKWFAHWDTYEKNRFAFTYWTFCEGLFTPIMEVMMSQLVYGDLYGDYDVMDEFQKFVDEYLPFNKGLHVGDEGYRNVKTEGVYLGKALV